MICYPLPTRIVQREAKEEREKKARQEKLLAEKREARGLGPDEMPIMGALDRFS